MALFTLENYLQFCVDRLSLEICERPSGSKSHGEAGRFVRDEMIKAEFETVLQEYPCPDWSVSSWDLEIAGETIPSRVNIHSPSCDVTGELVLVTSAGDVESQDLTGKIAVAHGELTGSSFFPKNFDRQYFSMESQDRFIEALEKNPPVGLVTVNHYETSLLPVINDSEFPIPSVTVSRGGGESLIKRSGFPARLKIASMTRESSGANIIGLKPGKRGKESRKIVLSAHYDTYPGTPGALDNASGVACMLSLANLLKDVEMEHSLELIGFGGEDSWFPGDALYLREYPSDVISALINIDGVGLCGGTPVLSLFNFSEELEGSIHRASEGYGTFSREPFYASDHGFFVPLGIPTIALTSRGWDELLGDIVHMEGDVPGVLDMKVITGIVGFVREIVLMLDRSSFS